MIMRYINSHLHLNLHYKVLGDTVGEKKLFRKWKKEK